MEIRIALLYTVWTGDDMEMLARSIERHEPFVDGIILSIQELSNKHEYGGRWNQCVPIQFPNKTIPIFYTPRHINTKENERIKHNLMIQNAKKQGFTHFIMCACDHFYDKETFENAKKLHLEHDLDVTFTKMITYYKYENWVLWPLENYYMPFIHKMHPNTEISNTVKYPVLVDPSVKVNTFQNYKVMDLKDGVLHHYSMVRKDIQKKFRNAASSIRWTKEQVETFTNEYENAKIGDKITYFKGAELVEIEDLKAKIHEENT